MKISQMANNVKHQTIEITFEVDDKEETIELEPLKKMDWGRIQNELGKNMWKQIISATAEIQDGDEESGMMGIMGEMDDRVQLEMFYQKFKRQDSSITRDQVDDLITYGIEDQEEYFRALMFMFQGVDITEAREELEDKVVVVQKIQVPRTNNKVV